jgi:hypothetical protein
MPYLQLALLLVCVLQAAGQGLRLAAAGFIQLLLQSLLLLQASCSRPGLLLPLRLQLCVVVSSRGDSFKHNPPLSPT